MHRKKKNTPLLRIWVNPDIVVLGRFSRIEQEVNIDTARKLGIPVTRRVSGGGSVFHDYGNLNMSYYIPSYERLMSTGEIYSIGTSLIVSLLEEMGFHPRIANKTDIVIGEYKVSGSAAFSSKRGSVYHATLLVESNIDLLNSLLVKPSDPTLNGKIDPVKYNPGNLRYYDKDANMSKVFRFAEEFFCNRFLDDNDFILDIMEESYRLLKCKYSNMSWVIHGKHNCKKF